LSRRAREATARERRRSLAQDLGHLAERAHAEAWMLEASRLLELGRALLDRRLGELGEAGEGEAGLAGLQRRDQAELLREALELRLAESWEGRLLGSAPTGGLCESEWRRRCAEEIGFALSSGTRVPGELLACALAERRVWPVAGELLSSLLRLDRSAASRACAARALFAAGRPREAHRQVAHIDLAELTHGARTSLLEALASDAERRGREARALQLFERAAACGAGASAELSVLLLALRRSRPRVVEGCLERLRRRAPSAACLARGLEELERKRQWMRRDLSAAERHRIELLLEDLLMNAPCRPGDGERLP